MKAITLWQPWASLLILGVKEFETRGRSTNIRGTIAIHAGLKVVPFDKAFGKQPEHVQAYIRARIDSAYGSYENLPRGAVLGTARIAGTEKTETAIRKVSEIEYACGDYSARRYAWALKDARPLDQPVPAKGAQGFWNWKTINA